jgi:hypothetical protein
MSFCFTFLARSTINIFPQFLSEKVFIPLFLPFFFSSQYWGLNLGPHTCQASTVLLGPFCFSYFSNRVSRFLSSVLAYYLLSILIIGILNSQCVNSIIPARDETGSHAFFVSSSYAFFLPFSMSCKFFST